MGLLDKVKESLGIQTTPGQMTQEQLAGVDAAAEEKNLAQWIRMQVEEIRSGASRVAHEGIWMQNMASVLGFQNLKWNAQLRSFQPVNKPLNGVRRNRITVNKMLPYLQNRLAKLTKNPPKLEVRPNDSTQQAKDNARFKMDILTAKWEELGLNNAIRQDKVMMTEEYGHAYLGVFWDDSKGNLIPDPDDETGATQMFEGDIRVDVMSPLEIFPDPMATSMEEAKFWIRAKVRHISYFRDQYGDKGKAVKPEEVWLHSAQQQARINTMNPRGGGGSGQEAFKNCALELTYFERPCKKYPKGRMIVAANGVLLKNEELPTGKINIVKFDCVKVGGKYYSESLVTHARPVLEQYNQVIRRRADWTNKLLAGKYIYPKGAELIRESLTDESGEAMQYTPVPNAPDGGKPTPLEVPNIPQYAYQEEDKLDNILAEIFGIGEVSRGTLPSASVPALGMQMLVEADDARIAPQIINHEDGSAKVGQLILDYVQQYYKTPRKMKFLGKNEYLIKTVSGEMLEGDNDVSCVRGSMIPGSKALKRQDVTNALSLGLYGDIADPKVRQEVISQMEIGNMDPLFVDASLKDARAKRVVEEIKRAELPDIDEGDPLTVILQEMMRFKLSEEYEGYGPDVDAAFKATREECMRILGEQMGGPAALSPEEEEMAMQDAAKNIPPDIDPLTGEELLPPTTEQVPVA
jgi:hypothetical protein